MSMVVAVCFGALCLFSSLCRSGILGDLRWLGKTIKPMAAGTRPSPTQSMRGIPALTGYGAHTSKTRKKFDGYGAGMVLASPIPYSYPYPPHQENFFTYTKICGSNCNLSMVMRITRGNK